MSEQIKELMDKKAEAAKGGGDAKLSKQHQSGKMTARERIAVLMDPNSFVELDAFVETRASGFDMQRKKVSGDGVVTGYGTIDGRLVFVSSQDFTVIGGSLGEMHANKIVKVMDMAVKMGAPFICINDSGGARIEEGIDALSGFGNIFYRNTLASGVIPQISIIMGPCAGGAVYSPAITDFVFMVENTSQMFITGPQVIKAVTGEEVSLEELGGAQTHNQLSGVAHFKSTSEEECLNDVKKLLKYIPDNNLSSVHVCETKDNFNRMCTTLDNIIPVDSNKPYDVKRVINEVVDDQDFLEIHKHFAPNIVVGFASIGGKSVGIIANQSMILAGVLDVNSSDKAARFVRFCDSFNIPILTFTDVPGYLPGVSQELNGIIRHGAKLLYAFSEATVPKINVITHKAYGGAYIAMNSKHLGCDIVFAWPSAEIAVMGAEAAANIIFKRDISSSDDPGQTRKTKIEQYKKEFLNPYKAAARGYIDDIIIPSHTRAMVINAFNMLETKKQIGLSKKHGNIPV